MTPDFALAQNIWPSVIFGTLIIIATSTALALMLVPSIRKRILPKPVETRLADFLPFDRILPDGITIVCRDGTISQMIEVGGIDQSFLSDKEQVPLLLARKGMIDNVAGEGVTLRFFLKRERVYADIPEDFDNKLAEIIAKRWNKRFKSSFINRMVIAISMPGGASDVANLTQIVGLVCSSLHEYSPTTLSQNPDTSIAKDLTLCGFYTSLISPVSRHSPGGTGSNLSDALTSDTVEFRDDGLIEFTNGKEKKFASFIGLRRLGDYTSTIMTSELYALPHEMTIMQVAEPIGKRKAQLMLSQNKLMMQSTTLPGQGAAVNNQYQAALTLVEGADETRASLCYYSEIITVWGDSEKDVEAGEKAVTTTLITHGFNAVREKGCSQASFFMQFPSVKLWPRIYRLFSTNIAQLMTLDRPPVGLSKSDWGPGPICMLNTASSTAYSHQFHANLDADAPAHGLCIAPTGGGKTTTFSFLAMMAGRHTNVKTYIFDRMNGAYIFTTSMGGKYLAFNSSGMPMSVRGGMNPFQEEYTTENVEFQKLWLQAISECDDQASIDDISRGIDIGYTALPRHMRSLAMMHKAAFTPGSPLSINLKRWVDPQQYGPMFNAEEDTLDLVNNQLVAFDMTNLTDDPKLASASIAYILHKVRQTLVKTGSRALIFIDETAPMLQDPIFRKMYLVMLREFRKLGGAVISVFQSPDAMKESAVGQAVRQQCGVYYLWPNPGAAENDYDDFELNDREKAFIMGRSPLNRRVKRGLLIKRPATRESVVVDIDLSSLGPYLKIFSSGSRDVRLASDMQKQYHEKWVKEYLTRANDPDYAANVLKQAS